MATSISGKKYQRTYVLEVPGHLHNPVVLTGAPLKISRRTESRRHAVSTFNKCLNSVADLGVSQDPNRNQNVGHDSPVVTIRKGNFWSLELFPVVKKGWALRIKRNCYFGIRHVGLLSQFLSGSKIQPDVLIAEMEHFKYMPA